MFEVQSVSERTHATHIIDAEELRAVRHNYLAVHGREASLGEEERFLAATANSLAIGIIAAEQGDARTVLRRCLVAARRGRRSLQAMRFDVEATTDGGRAIINLDAEWTRTLTGAAARFHAFWTRELRPLGLRLAAEVVDYPGGLPGEAALYLVWD